MKLCIRIFRATLLALIALVLVGSTVLASFSYYANIQVQETSGNPYDYLQVIAAVDNDYLADNGYISITGLDTRVLSGSTELKHLVVDDQVLFVAPTVGANSTGNYKYTLGNTDDLGSFPVVVGYNGYLTIADDDTLDGGVGGMDDFALEFDGYVDTSSGADKNLIYKEDAFRVWVSDTGEISVALIEPPTAATETVQDAADLGDPYDFTINRPAETVDGNILFTLLSWRATVTLDTVPAGWTLLGEELDYTDRYALYYKVASGEGASYTWSFSGNPTDHRIICTSYSCSYDHNDPIDVVSNSEYRVNDTTCRAASMTTTSIYSPIFFFGSSWHFNAVITFTKPTTPTEDWLEDYDGYGSSDFGSAIFSMQWSDFGATSDMDATLSAAEDTKHAFAVALNPFIVDVSGIASGVHTVKAYADGTDLGIIIDEGEAGEVSDTTLLSGASVPANTNDWVINQNNVMPYFDYYKHTVSDTLIAWYQPVCMITGTTLDDREGTDAGETGTAEEDATITWGANPAGVTATIGSLVSSSQPGITPAGEEDIAEIVPEGSIPSGGIVDVVALRDNPLYPVVAFATEYLELTEEQIWFGGATLIILMGMGLAVGKVPNHLLLAGTIGLVLSGFFTAQGIYQWWMLLIFFFMFIASVIMERKPVI